MTRENVAAWTAAGTAKPEAHRQFWQAVVAVRDGELEAALAGLAASFAAGYPTPMDAIGTGLLAPLAADPATRPQLRALWLEHACESVLVMAGPAEPGTHALLQVRLVDADSGAPVAGARLEVQHTDATGRYFAEDSLWNVRLYGAGRSDERGQVTVATITPGYYAAEHDPDGTEPRHLHFMTSAAGYRDIASEAGFSDDPRRNGEDGASGYTVEVRSATPALVRGTLTIPLVPR